MNRTKRIAVTGILIACALALSYLESQIPVFFAVPGMKLGLANLAVLLALWLIDAKTALFVNGIRILLVFLLFGNSAAFLYSLAGGMLSTLLMIGLKKTGKLSLPVVSVAGGVCHNAGQILVASLLLQTPALLYYLVILWFAGIASGALIGLLGAILWKRLAPVVRPDSSGPS